MNRHDIMIDIETLGNTNDALIVTIGVAAFNIEPSGSIYDKFQTEINVATAQQAGGVINADTVMWWMEQSKEAQQSLISKSAVGIRKALEDLALYIANVRTKNARNNITIWAKDPDFDCTILQSAYDRLDIICPWAFWETRSCRTMDDVAKLGLSFDSKRDMPRTGTHHNAADDAEYQAAVVREIYKRMTT